MKKITSMILALILLLTPLSVSAKEDTPEFNRIFIGDSRTVGISLAINTQYDTYIAKVGMSYNWFKTTALPALKKTLNKNNNVVYINMGVNDCANATAGGTLHINDYIEDINNLIKEYPDTEFYYISVNPVDGNYPSSYAKGGYIDKDKLNNEIEEFNNQIKSSCNATYIDTSTYLKDTGFKTSDGIHFTSATNKEIYNYSINFVEEKHEEIAKKHKELADIFNARLIQIKENKKIDIKYNLYNLKKQAKLAFLCI